MNKCKNRTNLFVPQQIFAAGRMRALPRTLQ